MLNDTKATKVLLIVLVVILGLSFSLFRGCDIRSRGSRADQTVDFKASDSLKVSTMANNVIIEVDPKATRAKVSIGKSDSDSLRVSKSGSQLTVEVKPVKKWFRPFFSYRPTNLVIVLPTAQLNTLEVSSISGSVRVMNALSGQQIKLSSTSGKVDVLDIQAERDLRLSSVSGAISSGSIESSRNVEVNSTSGSLQLQKVVAPRSKLRSVSGSISAKVLLQKDASLEAGSISGSVQVELKEAKDLSLTASTTSGRITFNGQEQAKRASSSVGSANQMVTLSTVSGSITATY